MNKRTLILAVLAVVLVLCSGIGSTVAYFTTYSNARGGYVIHLGGRTEIEEKISNNRKTVQIFNRAETDDDIGQHPVFVRVKAFTDSDGTLDYSANTSGLWQQGENGYWYYQKAITAGTDAKPEGALTDPAFIVDVKLNRALKEGEYLDVIVVHESVPAIFKADGSPDLDTAWATGDITVVNG